MIVPNLVNRIAKLQGKGLTWEDIAYSLGYGKQSLKTIFGKKKKQLSEKKRHLSHTGVPNKKRQPCRFCQKLLDERGWL